MKNPEEKLEYRRTVRLSENDEKRLVFQAEIAGISVAAYIRHIIANRGPVISRVDELMVKELRRLGGLLKANFDTLRNGNAPASIFENQEEILKKIGRAVDKLGNNYDS